MGAIKTNPQVNQDGSQSPVLDIEITYGGREAPFGSLETGTPPAYISPNSFAAVDGFLVIEDKLCGVALNSISVPTLPVGYTFLKMGTFYNSSLGQVNYVLSYKFIAGTISVFDFNIQIWNYTSLGAVNLLDSQTRQTAYANPIIAPTAASFTMLALQGESLNFTDTGHFGFQFKNNGVLTQNVTVPYNPGDTLSTLIPPLITAVNAATATILMTATATFDGFGIILTANTPGTAGNLLSVSDFSTSNLGGGNPPAFFFSGAFGTSSDNNLIGGSAQVTITVPSTLSTPSVAEVGGVLYISNIGPLVLKYFYLQSGNSGLVVSSTYNGYKVISKFSGSLIGLGVLPFSFTQTQNSTMIFAWSSTNILDVWNPNKIDGNVTGAGSAQLADISDALIGLVVTNNVAYIIRSQGISYATAVQSGQIPFSFQHISLGDLGEGAPSASLVAQYDQAGFYIGNSNIYEIGASGLNVIGDKIKAIIFNSLSPSQTFIGAAAAASYIGNGASTLVLFAIGSTGYLYNASEGNWTQINYNVSDQLANTSQSVCATIQTPIDAFSLGNFGLVLAYENNSNALVAYEIQEVLPTNTSKNAAPQITFPVEELVFGRDVTISSIYMNFWANLTQDLTVSFFFGATLFGSIVLPAAFYNTLSGNPSEFKIYGTQFTARSPQLRIAIGSGKGQIRFSKIQLFGSFDPTQKPVL